MCFEDISTRKINLSELEVLMKRSQNSISEGIMIKLGTVCDSIVVFVSALLVLLASGILPALNDAVNISDYKHLLLSKRGPLAFQYSAEVAYQPKDRSDAIYSSLENSLNSPTGEDNYFIAGLTMENMYVGVTDGVGGWAERGFDSSAISRELCSSMQAICSKQPNIDPKTLLQYGYDKTVADGIVQVGSTTANIAHLDSNGTLSIANLGDSWCGVYRANVLVFESKIQTVSFNAPYQLSIIPDEIMEESRRSGNSFIINTPGDADEYSFQLQNNDLVLLSTDGLIDNIPTQDIIKIINAELQKRPDDLKVAIDNLIKVATALSKDPSYESVFAKQISQFYNTPYTGGKEDDITAILIQVKHS